MVRMPWETIAREGFQFFGKMSASISHEIKNALAIINESAGLLEDFSLLTEKGRPIDPERLKRLAQSVARQVQRADGLIKNLNRFAHSADDASRIVDLAEMLELVVSLVQRLAAMREARVELVLPAHPVMVITNLFLLENIIWLGLEFLLTENHKVVKLIPETTAEGARIRLVGQFGFPGDSAGVFPSEKEKAILDALKAELRMEPQAGEMILFLQKNI
jgi:nitrogen fixation/metabolism regulation signal transduction histidine kinase